MLNAAFDISVVSLPWGKIAFRISVVCYLPKFWQTILRSTLQHSSFSVEKFSRWLRTICTISLSRNTDSDRTKAIGYIEQALTVMKDHCESHGDESEVYLLSCLNERDPLNRLLGLPFGRTAMAVSNQLQYRNRVSSVSTLLHFSVDQQWPWISALVFSTKLRDGSKHRLSFVASCLEGKPRRRRFAIRVHSSFLHLIWHGSRFRRRTQHSWHIISRKVESKQTLRLYYLHRSPTVDCFDGRICSCLLCILWNSTFFASLAYLPSSLWSWSGLSSLRQQSLPWIPAASMHVFRPACLWARLVNLVQLRGFRQFMLHSEPIYLPNWTEPRSPYPEVTDHPLPILTLVFERSLGTESILSPCSMHIKRLLYRFIPESEGGSIFTRNNSTFTDFLLSLWMMNWGALVIEPDVFWLALE